MPCYLHSTPGRLRVKIAEYKKNPALAASMADCLKAVDGVREVSTNRLTGSLLVKYDTEMLGEEQVFEQMRACRFFDPSRAKDVDSRLKAACNVAGEKLAKVIMGVAVDGMLKRTGLGFLAILL